MVSKKSRQVVRENKHRRMRNRFSGTPERPRLAVFRSNNHMYFRSKIIPYALYLTVIQFLHGMISE